MMPFYYPNAIKAFIRGFERDLDRSEDAKLAKAAEDQGQAVKNLLTDTEEGLKKALDEALAAPTSLVAQYNGYRIVIAKPVNAAIGRVGGGLLVTDGKNSVAFDTTSGLVKTSGEVHRRGQFYWDLGARDEVDELFIIPKSG